MKTQTELLTIGMTLLMGCGDFRVEKPQTFSQLEPGIVPGYNRLFAEVFSKKCTTCHTNGGNIKGVNLDTYANALAALERIRSKVVINNQMPMPNGLPGDEHARVKAWVEGGAPENDTLAENVVPPPVVPAPTPTPTSTVRNPSQVFYADVAERVFGRCIQCHGSPGIAGVSLDSYENVTKFLNRVQARALVLKTMPPTSPLSEVDQELLQAWIDQGARK